MLCAQLAVLHFQGMQCLGSAEDARWRQHIETNLNYAIKLLRLQHEMVGGRFCGHFFGKNDEWANNTSLTIHSYEDLVELFENQFVIEYSQIEDGLVPCANGKMKHWHTYYVVAKKIN